MISLGRETNGGRSKRKRLRNHGANVFLNNKQLFRNATQVLQNKLDLFDPNDLTQVRVNH